MEPEIACDDCGARVPLGRARRIAGGIVLHCNTCGQVFSWPASPARPSHAVIADDPSARPRRRD